MRSVSIHVHGRVQGVFFRHHTGLKARELGLKGFVQNEADGSVRIEAEGDASAIDALILWCRRGPDAARVEGVDVTEKVPRGCEAFEIRR